MIDSLYWLNKSGNESEICGVHIVLALKNGNSILMRRVGIKFSFVDLLILPSLKFHNFTFVLNKSNNILYYYIIATIIIIIVIVNSNNNN